VNDTVRIGTIICDFSKESAVERYLRSLVDRQGQFSIYHNKSVKLVGYTICDGCHGGNIEDMVREIKNKEANMIHISTGEFDEYPPCPYINYLRDYIPVKCGIQVIHSTYPIPDKYFEMQYKLDICNELI